MTDKRNSLNQNKLDKLLFLKKTVLILKEIKKKGLIKHDAHPKLRLSRTDHQSALMINQSENFSLSST